MKKLLFAIFAIFATTLVKSQTMSQATQVDSVKATDMFWDLPSGSPKLKKATAAQIKTFVGAGSGLYLPLAGGTMDSGSHIYFGIGSQNISQGTFDNSTGGNRGISLNCAVGYELNWQGGHLSSSYNNGNNFNALIVDTALLINGTIQITDGTQGNGKVLTSDANGLASWQGSIIYDSLTALTGQTITLTNNSTLIIAASGTIVSVTWSFPAGVTGDVLDIENMQAITTLNITGTGTGTITAAKITNTKLAGLKTFHNYGGNWY